VEAEALDQRRVAGRAGDRHRRECGVSARRPPSVMVSVVPAATATPAISAENAPPLEVRLDADAQQQVTVGTGQRRVEELGLRPRDTACAPVVERHRRPDLLEVDVLVRVDDREAPRVEARLQVRRGQRGGAAAVVPPVERGDHDRLAQRRARGVSQRRHPGRVPAQEPCVGCRPPHRV
jgi:hypothetical protein